MRTLDELAWYFEYQTAWPRRKLQVGTLDKRWTQAPVVLRLSIEEAMSVASTLRTVAEIEGAR